MPIQQERPATGVVDRISDIPRRAADWMHETEQERQLRPSGPGSVLIAPRGRLAAMSRVQLVAVGLLFFLIAMAVPVGITLAVTAGSRNGESSQPPATENNSTGENTTDEPGGRANAPLVVPIETPTPEPTPTIDPIDEAAVAAATQAAEAATAAARTRAPARAAARPASATTRRPDALDALAARVPTRTANVTAQAPPPPPPPAAAAPATPPAAQAAMACATTTQVVAHDGQFLQETIRLCSDGTRDVLSTREPSPKASPKPSPSPSPTPKSHCSDGIDNDSDGHVDMLDLGCADPSDNKEQDPAPAPAPPPDDCHDGIDNDGDGLVDQADPGCAAGAVTETPFHADCADGVDNDGDGFIDLADPQCTDAQDDSELPVDPIAECKDGLDNDADGLVDLVDPDCAQNPNTAFERAATPTVAAGG
ncbi:MAG: hypothetical protein ACT4OM_13380 [Actinomycetota bacterium]